jgi:streptogramin lyase
VAISSDPRIGSELAGYRIEALLGRGGMGVVYRAHDLALDRPVALKVLSPELAAEVSFRERFLTESRLAASIDHPNIVPVYDAGEVAGELFIAMRYVEGRDLRELLREGRLAPQRAIALCSQVADALDAAHERGLVHRDVKPSNVLLDPREHAYLADFGLTRRLADRDAFTAEARSLGTIDYVSPEQIRGDEVDGRADVYSLGCLLYECFLGEPPFRRSTDAAALFAHLEEEPPAPPGLERVIPKALAKEPSERHGTCTELIEDAREALGIAAPRRSGWPLALAIVGLLLIGAAALAFFLSRGGGSVPSGQPGRLLRIDPASNRVAASIPVGNGPAAVAVGSGRVWVASYVDGTLWQLDPRTGEVTKIPALGRPYAVTVQAGEAYVAALGPSQFGGNVAQYDAVSGGHGGGVPSFACSLTSGEYGVWIAGCPNVQELSIDGSNVAIGARVKIPFPAHLSAANFREGLGSMAMGEGAVWVVGDAADQRLWRIDPRSDRVVSTIALGFPPASVAAGDGAVWVTDQLGDRLVEVDPTTDRMVRSIPVGRGAAGVALGGSGVWVAGAIDHTVTRVDAASGRVVDTIRVAASPQAVAVGDGGVWVVGNAG